jgi:hypothetical protein
LTAGKDRVRIESAKELIIMGIFGKDVHHHETVVVNKKTTGAAIAEGLLSASSSTDAEVALRAASDDAERAELESITSLAFGSTVDEISNQLSNLFSIYSAHKKNAFSAMPHDTAMKKAATEKIEFGLMRLNKLDPDSAEFFQTKYDNLGGSKKRGGLFGKKK